MGQWTSSYVTCTVPSEEMGKVITLDLIERQLVPCVNIIRNICSIYTWKGAVNDGIEFLLVMKTRKILFQRVLDEIKALHTYAYPEILAILIVDGNPPYLEWIDDNTGA